MPNPLPWHCMAPQRIVLLYDRISKDQAGTKESTTNQRKANRAEAARYEPDQVIEYTDRDKSASDPTVIRTDFQRLLRDIRSGMYDGALIIAWAQDRFLRDDVEYATTKKLLNEHNIRFIAPKDGVDLVPEGGGEMLSGMRQLFAAEEIRKMKNRLALKLAANRGAGRRHGKVPFGWNPDGSLEPEQSTMIRDATHRLLRGESMSSICDQWNADGKPRMTFIKRTLNGEPLDAADQVTVVNPWTAGRLGQLLRRPANAGVATHNGHHSQVAGDWTPILTKEEWSAVCGKTLARANKHPTRRSLLGGLITCARDDCGGAVHGVTNRSEGHEYLIYRCGRCNHQLRQGAVDDYVEKLVVDRLEGMAPVDLVDSSRKAEMEAITTRVALLQGRRQDANDRYADIDRKDAIDSATHAQLLAKLDPALKKAEQERDRLTEDAGSGLVLAGLIGPGARVAWEACTRDRKRSVIALLTELHMRPGDRFTPVEKRIDARLRRGQDVPAR